MTLACLASQLYTELGPAQPQLVLYLSPMQFVNQENQRAKFSVLLTSISVGLVSVGHSLYVYMLVHQGYMVVQHGYMETKSVVDK